MMKAIHKATVSFFNCNGVKEIFSQYCVSLDLSLLLSLYQDKERRDE